MTFDIAVPFDKSETGTTKGACGRPEPASFRLGVRHLDGNELALNWLIRGRMGGGPILSRRVATALALAAVLALTSGLLSLGAEPSQAFIGLGLALAAVGAFAVLLWWGAPVLLAAPLMAFAAAVALSPSAPIAAFETRFAGSAGGFVGQYFAIFVLGAMFGRILVSTGCAQALARPVIAVGSRPVALLSIAGLSAAMTLCGVGVFVIAFAVFPIARQICAHVGLEIALAPAAIAFGAFTVTMTLPGAPSLTNIIAGSALGTTAFAAPWQGLVAALVIGAFGVWWLWRAAVLAPATEKPEPPARSVPAPSVGFAIGMFPLVVAVVCNAVLTALAPTHLPAALVAGWGSGYWCVLVSLIIGITTALLVGKRAGAADAVKESANAAVLPLAGTAVCIGFGSVLASGDGLALVLDTLTASFGAGGAAFSAAVAGLCAFVTGSSSGGLALALELQADVILAEGLLSAPELHRFASLGAGTLDTLPHSAAVISLLAICGTSHAAAYRGIFMTTVIGPTLGLVAALLL